MSDDKPAVIAKFDDILEGLIDPAHGGFSPDLARYVLGMRFSEEQAAQYELLADQKQNCALTPAEREDLEVFLLQTHF